MNQTTADLLAGLTFLPRSVLASANAFGQIRHDGWREYRACLLLEEKGLGSWAADPEGRPLLVLVLNEAGRDAARKVGWGCDDHAGGAR